MLAVLARPEALPPPAPPRLGGMATPLGVYLHDGVSSRRRGLLGSGSDRRDDEPAGADGAGGRARAGAGRRPRIRACLAAGRALTPPGLQLWLSAISPWLPLPFVFLLLRLVPLSGTHAAEHQVVHCIERHAPLVPDCVRAMPRVHPRCGTNCLPGLRCFC